MKTVFSRLTAFLLALVMLVCMVPVQHVAAAQTEEPAAQAVTEASEEPTEESTEAPAEAPAETPTEAPTEAPAEEPTEAPAEAPAEAPTEAPTEEATEEATEAPTEEPTEAPTEAPTEEPGEESISASSDAVAAGVKAGKFEAAQLDIISQKKSDLAPGITEDRYVVYDKNGAQVKMFIATADMRTDSVKVFAAYKDMNPTSYGMSKLTEQVAAFNEKAANGDTYYTGTVVAGINASYYNMQNGKPTGAFVMNGVDVTDEKEGNDYGYFAVMKDGTVKIGKRGEYSSDKGKIQEAVGIYFMLIEDGKIVLADSKQKDPQKYPRQTIGITADGKVITMSADGNQAPNSVGLTLMEQAQVMMDLGCVMAGHLDGGGSMTYASKAEGSDKFQVTNNPSDGSERSVSNGFIMVSTAVASYDFHHVTYALENEYVTPGSTVAVSMEGVSATGHGAQIPADLTYEVTNGTYSEGVITVGSELGQTVITAKYNGKDVGSAAVNVVLPDKLIFGSTEMTVPFGKSVDLKLTAANGIHPVAIKAEDITFELSNDIGSIEGFIFTANNPDARSNSAEVKATLVANTEVTAIATITLGKGSEVIFDFEDGTDGGFYMKDTNDYNYVWPEASVSVVDSSSGMVHSGDKALALHINYSNSLEAGYMRNTLRTTQGWRMQNATSLGMWIYIPDEAVALWARWQVKPVTGYDEQGNPNAWGSTVTGQLVDGRIEGKTGYVNRFEESGWHYLSIDLSAYKDVMLTENWTAMQFYISDRDGADHGYYKKNQTSLPSDLVFYVDDITVDYSSAVDDRDAPVFENPTYAAAGMADAVGIARNSIPKVNSSAVTFAVRVSDYAATNTTGLNAASAKAYLDGNLVGASYSNGMISTGSLSMADGVHTIRFVISDNQGNESSVIRQIQVQAGSDQPTIKVVPHDAALDRILLGSIYYVDVVATDIEKVQSVTTVLDLNNISIWNLRQMEVAPGFRASYSIREDENIATVTITRTGEVETTGEAYLVSIPIRTWELKTGYTYPNGTKAGEPAMTYKKFRDTQQFWAMDISVEIDKGAVSFVDGSSSTFSGARVQVDTEMWADYPDMSATAAGAAYYNTWNGGHTHTAAPIADKAATCLESGYTGRTFCEVCSSPVAWGSRIPATGHSYAMVDGILKCVCGKLFNGIWTDGKEYKDGVAIADGWMDDSYYQNGVKYVGIQLVDGCYYDFGEDGICTGRTKYTGLYYDESVSAWKYAKVGVLIGGWVQIGDYWHYFKYNSKEAATGTYKVNSTGVTYEFNEQGMTKGAWHTDEIGARYWYGPERYRARQEGYMTLQEIDGKTYNFDGQGYITPGIWALRDSTSFKRYVFEFDTDGSLLREIKDQGPVVCADGTYFINADGYVPMNAGLVQFGKDYYFVVYSGKLALDAHRTITEANANGLKAPGQYYFDETGKLVEAFTGIKAVDGVDYYFVDGEICQDAGLVEVEGELYYVVWSGKIVKNAKRNVTEAKANGLKAPGQYYFDDTGKLVEPFNGIKAVDGVDYYFVDGEICQDAGLVKIGEDLYYVVWSGKIVKDAKRNITAEKANGLIAAGQYYFDTDGKLVKPFTGIKAVDGVDYYFVDGEICQDAGLVKIGNDLYYVVWSGKIVKNAVRNITEAKANGLVEPGLYTFNAEGKMAIE